MGETLWSCSTSGIGCRSAVSGVFSGWRSTRSTPELLYVNYTRGDGATVVSEFTVSGDPPIADPSSERVILVVAQPAGNHNGGMIAFGPQGDLWIGMGDGGGSNDRFGNGQRDDTLLGAMLRIRVGPDVDPYGVVEGLGFTAPEIWAIGLRNPWRFSFDGDQIWIGDVGQGDVEEIDSASTGDRGLNFGWPIYEGTDCFAGPCDPGGLDVPCLRVSARRGVFGHRRVCLSGCCDPAARRPLLLFGLVFRFRAFHRPGRCRPRLD